MSSSKDLHDNRRNYTLSQLTEDKVSVNPFEQFGLWYNEATQSEIMEPNAMSVSTANATGRPSSRIVLLKAFSEQGFIFYTNYDSRKGHDLAANNQAALLFFWDKLERQIRIEGSIQKLSAEESDVYFYSRPFESQLSAVVSNQSTEVPNRAYLEGKLEQLRQQEKVQRPENWGGYIIKPDYFEFWQGRANRLHDRLVYKMADRAWKLIRLAP